MSGLIWSQTVWHWKIFFENVNFKKQIHRRQKSFQNYPACSELRVNVYAPKQGCFVLIGRICNNQSFCKWSGCIDMIGFHWSLNGKWCRPWLSRLIWICTVFLGMPVYVLKVNVAFPLYQTSLGGSVWCVSDWWSGGHVSDSHWVRQHSVEAIDHELLFTVILSLLLIQEGQLSVSGERICTNAS